VVSVPTPHQRKIAAIVSRLLEWYPKNARDLPWRRTTDPYSVYVSEIMLQQTQVKTVVPYWQRWIRRLPDVRALARARPDAVLKLWEGLGYYLRARNLQKAARIIIDRHEGRFPEKFDDLLALPGVGRYTAGAVCSIAFNQPTPVLDGNVIRVLTRLSGIAGNPRQNETNARLWEFAQDLVLAAARREQPGERNCAHFNQSLMELGAVLCTPRLPKCPLCPVRKHCVARRENRTVEIPNLGQARASTRRRFAAFVIERNGRFLVRRRPAGVVNAHLWEFPNIELDSGRTANRQLAENLFDARPIQSSPKLSASERGVDAASLSLLAQLSLNSNLVGSFPRKRPEGRAPTNRQLLDAPRPIGIAPLFQVRHTITRFRITLDVFSLEFAKALPRTPEHGRWCSLSELQRLAFPSAHKKILQMLQTTRTTYGRMTALPQSPLRSFKRVDK